MSNSYFLGMPRPTIGSVLFGLCMLDAPLVGLLLAGWRGFFVGIVVDYIGLAWFFGRGLTCEICGRRVLNLGRGTPFAETLNIGTFMSTESMRQGYEGPGDKCRRCGRVYCTNCAQIDMICVYGSKSFQTVAAAFYR
jgi:hypothetical protein